MNSINQMRRVTAMVPEELMAGMDEVIEITGLSASDVLRDAITAYLFNGTWSGIGRIARQAILDGKTNEEALEEVLRINPSAATSLKSISWYRSELRRQLGDEKVPTDGAIKRLRQRQP